MPAYLYKGAGPSTHKIVVIEDKSMTVANEHGDPTPGYQFIDSSTVRAHPTIIDALIVNSERIWSLDEILESLDWPAT